MQKALVILGLVIVVVGLAWPWLGKLPLGRLPGDLAFEREGLRFYAPITTMILLSLLLSLAMWLFRR